MLVRKITVFIALLGVLFIGYGTYRFLVRTTIPNNESALLGNQGTGLTESLIGDSAQRRYVNSEYGFSFLYPKELSVGQFEDGIGETVVLQAATRPRAGFQIYIFSVSEPIELTPTFIEKDLSGVQVLNPRKIELDGKASGIIFESNNPNFDGGSYEIWFYYNGFIYQATSHREGAQLMEDIVGTWHFRY